MRSLQRFGSLQLWELGLFSWLARDLLLGMPGAFRAFLIPCLMSSRSRPCSLCTSLRALVMWGKHADGLDWKDEDGKFGKSRSSDDTFRCFRIRGLPMWYQLLLAGVTVVTLALLCLLYFIDPGVIPSKVTRGARPAPCTLYGNEEYILIVLKPCRA